jgi:hypothetical protein
MGGSSKKVTVGYKYYVGMHMALCHGPVDKLVRIRVGGKEAWKGGVAHGTISINKPDLFGGEKREGGISGLIDFASGKPDQGQNGYLASKLGASLLPAFRGVACAILRQVYIGLNPYLKDWAWMIQRINVRSNGAQQWYIGKAMIGYVFEETSYPATTTFQSQLKSFVYDTSTPAAIAAIQVPTGGWGGEEPAPFGYAASQGGLQPVYPINTLWVNGNTSLWLRKTISASGNTNIVISGYIENGALFYLNGVLVGTVNANNDQSATPSGIPYTITIPPQYQYAGDNELCILCLNEYDVEPRNPNIDNTYFYGIIQSQSISSGYADMNPAHIIRECLTDANWGMGYPESDIDDASFMAAADVLFSEKMGISILWSQQTSIEDFVGEILRHIDAALYVNRSTGKFVLRLIRGDYNEASLLVLDKSNIVQVENYSKQTLAELINEVTVTYNSNESGQTETVTLQNLAMIQQQGAVVPANVEYPGFTNASLASRVASRDLKALSTPMISATIYANRKASGLNIGDCFKWNWEEVDEAGVGVTTSYIMRVTEIALGDGVENVVRISSVQDVFGLPDITYVEVEPTEWEDPSAPPTPALPRLAIEMPYYEIVRELGEAGAQSKLAGMPELGYLMVAAGRQGAEINAELQVDSGAGYSESGTLDFCTYAKIDGAMGRLDTTITIKEVVDFDVFRPGSLAQIDDEIVFIEEIINNTATIRRGCLDTHPALHADNAWVVVWDGYYISDEVEYVQGDELDVKVLPISDQGPLPIADAPVDTVSMNKRAGRPYPPANIKINGQYYPTFISNTVRLELTWSHRDRLQQTGADVLAWADTDVGPEDGVTYFGRLLRADTQAELAVLSGVVDNNAVLNNYFVGNVLLELWSVRSGLSSFFKWTHMFAHTPFAAAPDAASCWKFGTVSGNVLLNDAPGLDAVSKVNGLAGNVGAAVAGSAGGIFMINANGTFSFDPDGDFDALTGEDSETTSVEYSASDGAQEASATLTVTVTAQSYDYLWDLTVLCINAEGAHGSTTFTDSKGAVVSRFGDTQIDTLLGYPAIKFDGTGDYLTIPNATANRIERGVFTFDAWVYFDGTSKRMGLVGTRPPTATSGCVIHVQSNNTIRLFMTGGGSLASTGTISAGLHHVEVSIDVYRTCRIFIDGVLAGSGSVGQGLLSSSPLQIGREQDGVNSEWLHARGPSLRITRGWRVRHTADFTPPQFPFGTAQPSRYSASLGGLSDVIFWVDASDSNALSLLSDDWFIRDKFGSDREFAQDSPAARPTLQADAINGRSALKFNGSQSLYVPLSKVPGMAVNSSFTVFAVFKGDGEASYSDFVMSTRVSLHVDNTGAGWGVDAQSDMRLFHAGRGEYRRTGALTRGAVCICEWEVGANATSPALYVDDVIQTPTTNSLTGGIAENGDGFLVIGQQSGAYMKGLLGEIVAIPGKPTTEVRSFVFNHLTEKWRG